MNQNDLNTQRDIMNRRAERLIRQRQEWTRFWEIVRIQRWNRAGRKNK